MVSYKLVDFWPKVLAFRTQIFLLTKCEYSISQGYVMCEKCTNCESPIATQPLSCLNDCSGEGLCDSATGQCLCNSGTKGVDCSSK